MPKHILVVGATGKTGNEICKTVNGGASVKVPLFLSSMTNWLHGAEVMLKSELYCTVPLAEKEVLLKVRTFRSFGE